MKTLLATHGWLDCPVEGYMGRSGECRRLERFLAHYAPLELDTLFIDNGSVRGPIKPRLKIVYLDPHYPRGGMLDYPAVWRSYWTLKRFLDDYDRIFYIATDAYVLSNRLMRYLESRTEGWTALWSPKYRFPEACIQVITRCDAFMNFFSGPCDPFKYNGLVEEMTLPFTHVEMGFTGDRYGEYDLVPRYGSFMDYYCQVPDSFDWDDSQFPVLGK